MHYSPKHAALRTSGSLRRRLVGVAVAGSATVAGGIALSSPPRPPASGTASPPARAVATGTSAPVTASTVACSSPTRPGPASAAARYASRADLASKGAQIAIAQKVLASQGPGAWPVCSVKAGLGRGNGGSVSSVSRSTTRSPIKAHGTNAAYHGGRLAVDGVMGPNTTRALQRWIGTGADGVFGPQSARALQRKVGVHADGKVGRNTVRALQSPHRRQPRRCLAPQRPHRARAAVLPQPPLISSASRRPDLAAGHEIGSTAGPDGTPVRASGVEQVAFRRPPAPAGGRTGRRGAIGSAPVL